MTLDQLIQAKMVPGKVSGDMAAREDARDLFIVLEQIALRRGSQLFPAQVLAERVLDGHPAWEHAGSPNNV